MLYCCRMPHLLTMTPRRLQTRQTAPCGRQNISAFPDTTEPLGPFFPKTRARSLSQEAVPGALPFSRLERTWLASMPLLPSGAFALRTPVLFFFHLVVCLRCFVAHICREILLCACFFSVFLLFQAVSSREPGRGIGPSVVHQPPEAPTPSVLPGVLSAQAKFVVCAARRFTPLLLGTLAEWRRHGGVANPVTEACLRCFPSVVFDFLLYPR